MNLYLTSKDNFNQSKPYFETATTFTEKPNYIEVLGYYVTFAQTGENLTMHRYTSTQYLKHAAENLSIGNMESIIILMENFTIFEDIIEGLQGNYDEQQQQIDEYLFFDEIREEH
jgi:hypothetical protein